MEHKSNISDNFEQEQLEQENVIAKLHFKGQLINEEDLDYTSVQMEIKTGGDMQGLLNLSADLLVSLLSEMHVNTFDEEIDLLELIDECTSIIIGRVRNKAKNQMEERMALVKEFMDEVNDLANLEDVDGDFGA